MNVPLSILHIDDAKTWRGGQHQVFLLINELHKLGVRQALATPEQSPLAQRLAQLPITLHPLKLMLGELDPFAPGRLARFAKVWGATHLHAHTGHAHTLGLRAARRAGLPLVVTRRVDFAIAGNWLSHRKYTAPGQRFIAISQAVREALLAGGVPAERISVVPSGVPPIDPALAWPRERVRAEFGIAADEIAIVSVGALTDHKDHHTLIAAAPAVLAAHPRVRFHLLGEGELRTALESQIAGLGLAGKVVLHGHVPEARLKLAGFDLFVSSSHLEGLGTAILDAMLARLPVVATAAGGVTDIVHDAETGWLAPPRDPATLAAAINHTLAMDDTGRRAIVNAAERMVMNSFSPAATASGSLQVYMTH